MAVWRAAGRVSRPGRLEGAGPGSATRGQLVDLARRVEAEPGQQVPGGLGQFGALPEGPGGPGEGAQVDPAEFAAHHRPGLACLVLSDADEQQREPAQQDVGADPFFEPVVDGPRVQHGFHVPPAAFDFEELLVSDGDVLGGQLRVGAAQQVLAVQVLLGFGLGLIGAEQPAGGDAQEPVQARHGRDLPAQLGLFRGGQLVGAGDHLFELGDELGADRGVASGGVGVAADDEPVGGVGQADFLDLHVSGYCLVAALPRQRGLDQRGFGAQFLADDVPAGALLQEPAVPGGGEPAVGDPDDLAGHPVPHVGLDLPDQRRITSVPGPGPDPDGDAVAGDGHADHDLRQVVAAVLGLAVRPESRCLTRVGVVLVAGLLAAPVPHGVGVGVLHFEVRRCGVEEQQVHFEVQQVRDLVEDLLLEVAADGVQPVHRPVARVAGHGAEPVDVRVLAHPLRRCQLGRRGERPVGDQAEQHPLGCGGVPRPAPPGRCEPGQDLPDPEPGPQLVQDVAAAVGPGLGEHQVAVGGGGQRVGGAEQPGQRGDEPPDRVGVELVLAAEAVEDLRDRPAGGGVPLVVRELQVPGVRGTSCQATASCRSARRATCISSARRLPRIRDVVLAPGVHPR